LKKPTRKIQRCGQESPQLFEEKEYEGHCKCMQKPPWIDSPRQVVSNRRWHTTWFLTVEEIFPLKDDHVNLPLKVLQTRSYRSALKLSKGSAWKGINTHQEPLIFIIQACDLLAQEEWHKSGVAKIQEG
jgi:hypothetical protein